MSIGPSLPPGWKFESGSESSESENEASASKPKTIGPSIPLSSKQRLDSNEGLELVDDFVPDYSSDSENEEEPQSSFSRFAKDSESPEIPEDSDPGPGPSIGPYIPIGSAPVKTRETTEIKKTAKDLAKDEADAYGPPLPPEFQEEEPEYRSDDEDIGPTLPQTDEETKKEYEERLIRLKYKEMFKDKTEQKREEWMTELPSTLKQYGLGARQFTKRGIDKSDNSWTDTPNQAKKERKVEKDSDMFASKASKRRDKELQSKADKLNKNRTASLMDIHNKKREQEIGKANKKERKPFDRETDLFVPKFREGAVKNLVKSTNLGTKFGHGSGQKFL